MTPPDAPVTPESIAAAKAYQAEQRAQFVREHPGWRIAEDGTVTRADALFDLAVTLARARAAVR